MVVRNIYKHYSIICHMYKYICGQQGASLGQPPYRHPSPDYRPTAGSATRRPPFGAGVSAHTLSTATFPVDARSLPYGEQRSDTAVFTDLIYFSDGP
jgi:hypothetical protein